MVMAGSALPGHPAISATNDDSELQTTKQGAFSMNWELLLLKYINHVGCEEGITYINRCSTTNHDTGFVHVIFTNEEIEALWQLDSLTLDEKYFSRPPND